jgi:mannosyl-oligosaccharide glucosidase
MSENILLTITPQTLGTTPGPYQKRSREIYTKLRSNIVNNVFNEWERTGFAWEQYNPETGAGQRTQHFTGWTSLVVKIMNMEDLHGKRHEEL